MPIFRSKQQSRLLNAEAKGSFSYLDFLQGTYGHELIGRLDGVARFALIPEKISWVLQEDFGQAQVDPFTPVTPTNRENINYVSTGPDLDLRLGFTRIRGCDGPLCAHAIPDESVRQQSASRAALPWAAPFRQAPRSRSRAAPSAFFSTIRWRIPISTAAASTGVTRSQGARTELRVNLGATKVDQGNESTTGPLAKLQLSRKLSATAKLTFTAGRDLIDAAAAFSALQGGAIGAIGATPVTGIGTAPAAVTSNNYTVTYASVGWQYARNRTTFGVSGQWEKDSYRGPTAARSQSRHSPVKRRAAS